MIRAVSRMRFYKKILTEKVTDSSPSVRIIRLTNAMAFVRSGISCTRLGCKQLNRRTNCKFLGQKLSSGIGGFKFDHFFRSERLASAPGAATSAPSQARCGRARRFLRPERWHSRSLFFRFSLVGLSQPHARPSTVFVDEYDPLTDQNLPNQIERGRIPRIPPNFDIRNRIPMQTRRRGQISYGPIQCGSRHPHLCTCHRLPIVLLSHVH
jgi:hypothetical protein